MKRYLFLKLGLSILVFAAASPRSQENVASNRDENRRNGNQNGPQSAPNDQRGDTKLNGRDYQGVMGKPGVDFPVLTYIPRTKFNCRGKKSGYYADLETNCQVFHICDEGRKVSFLCPNGTIFQQSDLICDWWFKVDCASSPNLYDESAEQLYEDNLKRKENRRVQQQERRTYKANNNNNDKSHTANVNHDSNNSNGNNNQNYNHQNHNSNYNNGNHHHKNNGVQSNQNKNGNHNNNFRNNNNNNGNSNQNENIRGREIVKQRKVVNTQRTVQTNYAKKDVTHYQENRYNNEQRIEQRSEYDAKETQEPSETASFVNNRYNTETQKNYYKSFNDIGDKTATFVPPKSYITGEFDSSRMTTERSSNRGGRNFNSGYTTNNNGYTFNHSGYSYNKVNKVSDIVKTTTQHTIYSPTVPPFSSRYTTRTPTTVPIISTQSRVSAKSKQVNGFYITKDVVSSTNTPSYEYSKTTPKTTQFPVYTTTTVVPIVQLKNNDFPINIDMLYTTPAAVDPTYRPLVASGIIAGSDEFIDNESHEIEESADLLNSRFSSTTAQETITPSIQTTTQEILRSPKKLTFSTLAPEENRIKNIPSIPTPFRTQTEAIPQTTFEDKQTTNRFQQYTYLPKAKTYIPKSETKIATPRPTIPTEYTTYSTMSSVTDNLNNMIKTLQKLEPDNPSIEKYLGTRPGLNIPPSAGPKTLHSLAIYFATALDNLVATNETELERNDEKDTTESADGGRVTLLSRTTQDKYNLLFNENHVDDNATHHETHEESPLDLKYLVEHDANDLDVQQSRGFVSSSTPRIRQLAQVFTQALSAYLDDPDTFKKVLEEIRPTEPPIFVEDITESAITTTVPSTTTTTTEYRSYTKEEDEVLDFSDVDKSSTYRPYSDNSISTTQSSYTTRSEIQKTVPPTEATTEYATTERPTPNYLALDLNNRLKLSTILPLENIEDDDESSTEDNTESQDYFPFNTGVDPEEAERKATASPYGFGVKPENSTPISIAQIPHTAGEWADLGLNNTEYKPSDSLQPPFKISLLNTLEETNSSYSINEESLQSAHSQSFLSHTSNTLNSDRTGKALKVDITTTEFPITETTSYLTQSPNDYTTTNSPSSTPDFESSTLFNRNRQYYDETTTNRNVETTTDLNRNRPYYDETTTDRSRFGETTTRQYEFTTDVNIQNRYYDETTTNLGETTTNRNRQYYDETTTDRNRQYDTTTNRQYDTTYQQNGGETTTQFYKNHQNNDESTTPFYRNTDGTTQFYRNGQNTDETTTQFYKNHQSADETTIYNINNQYFDEVTTYKRNRLYDTTTDAITTTTEYPRTESTTYNPTTTTEYTTTEQATTTAKPVPDNHWSTSPEVTKLWESTLYTDPLLINQKLHSRFGKDLELETIIPTTYSPEYSTQSRTTTDYIDESVIDLKFSTTEEPTEYSTTNIPRTTIIDLGIHNLLNSTELEIASSQAKQIFGNLDSTEQDLLIEKMKEAESNSTVRRLILLLVSTCDASLSNNKTVQETRNSILNALLNVPIADKLSNRSGRKLYETTTEYVSTTVLPETTSKPELTETSSVIDAIEVPNKTLHVKDVHQDTRALELLRSLYSLAAKWGKK